MEELKFRAWDKKNGGWLQATKSLLGHLIAWSNFNTFEILGRGDYELVQFTGMTDKHGKEIFEGDIVQPRNGEHVFYEIARRNGVFIRSRKFLQTFEGEAFERVSELPPYPKNHVVVGNIYENPELLEEVR